ncbi:hypothetical protein ACIP6Q_32775 [Streptomyces bobili]|uniref:hypothetical protein n=1 Tax=Streptomyces bobili TaxID=67280 RepID=UPI003817CE52
MRRMSGQVGRAGFGYRFLADEARGAGAGMADRTAWRICRDNRWWSVFGKKRVGALGAGELGDAEVCRPSA